MMRDTGTSIEVSGAMTLPQARDLLTTGNSLLKADTTLFDLSAVAAVDSSALAVIFGWLRQANALNRQIRISRPPQDLLSLAALYGVTELLPLDTQT